MEDEKKKKRNKKKKNKQGKPTDDADQNHVNNTQNGDVQNSEGDLPSDQPNCTLESTVAEAEKQNMLQVEATLVATIKELEIEKASHVQKEATLEETIKHLQSENDLYIQKEANLEETIKQLQDENDSLQKKEAFLEASIQKFQHEIYSHYEKEASLEEAIQKLLLENDSRIQKEAGLEEKINCLSGEKAYLELKQASLEDKTKHLEEEKEAWVVNEKTTKEAISSLNRDIARLRMQVVELEESRNQLLQEKQQLMKTVSGLQFQLHNHERSITPGQSSEEPRKNTNTEMDLNSQIEAAYSLIDKLVNENAELVEKVSELHIKLERQHVPAGSSISPEMSDVSGPPFKSGEDSSALHLDVDSPKAASVRGEEIVGNDNVVMQLSEVEHTDSGEIVQIPLHDTDARDVESQAILTDENAAVPLTDAPLIGAPFRLISFVAKYVSGADLLDKNAIHQDA